MTDKERLDDILFLKELQQELRTQETDCQDSPRFWVIRDKKTVACWEDQADYMGLCDLDRELLDWYREYIGDSARLVPCKEEFYIVPNTMFLTKKEAQEHIERNRHHYTSKVHTYAMTAWRAPKVKRLLEILETFDFYELAERVQELEEKNIQLEKDIKEWWIVNECWEEINTRLIEQNKRYREALEFYANRNNYKLEHFDPNLNDYMSTVDYDEGQKARQTIGSEKIND